jgi:hypothetical protein
MTDVNWKIALKAAGAETAQLMTSQLREEMLSSGWDSRLVAKIRVRFFNNKFEVKIPSKMKNMVSTLEYGSSDTPPSAVLRKFANRTQEAEKFLSQRAVAYMAGGKK